MADKNKDDIPFVVSSTQKTTITVLAVVLGVMTLLFVLASAMAVTQYAKKEKTPEPIIFEVDKTAHKIVRVEQGNLNATKQSLLRSVALREYVFNRETINHIDEKERWKHVRLMSSKSVYKDFQLVMNPELNEKSPFANKSFERRIEIITDYPIDKAKNIHRVEYYLTDKVKDNTYPTQRFVAVIQYGISDSYVSWNDRFINIDGLVIKRYEIYGA
ncbi:hypothetical protein GNP80_08860 [Aliivibrio fischeri]|uniref:type IV secretion system protein n=1 Tax=Aliivibrio fischeri TaxID=668 RepID=UPI0012D95037|nr:type IV secretion system protein [Aliivibrio fischeri]MUK92551.1 hypothetical protein [Aliivibrio fischeri]